MVLKDVKDKIFRKPSILFLILHRLQDLLIGGLDSGNEHRLVMAALLLIYTSRRGLLERELRLLLCTYEKSQGNVVEMLLI